MRTWLTVCTALALGACMTPYVEPIGPDTATLTFRNDSALDIGMQAFKVAEDCSGGKLTIADKTKLRPREQVSVRVQSNQAFSFFMAYSEVTMAANKYCIVPGTFTPRQGERYVASFTASETRCAMSLVKATSAGETKEPTFRPRTWRIAVMESGSFCQ